MTTAELPLLTAEEKTDLITRYYEAKKRVDHWKGVADGIAEELKEAMEQGDEVATVEGVRFGLSVQVKPKYGPDAAQYVIENCPAAVVNLMSISTAGLTKAKKANQLSSMDIAVLEGMAQIDTIKVLRALKSDIAEGVTV